MELNHLKAEWQDNDERKGANRIAIATVHLINRIITQHKALEERLKEPTTNPDKNSSSVVDGGMWHDETHYRQSVEYITNDLLERVGKLEEQEGEKECDCCGWDDAGYQHEPQCALKAATPPVVETDTISANRSSLFGSSNVSLPNAPIWSNWTTQVPVVENQTTPDHLGKANEMVIPKPEWWVNLDYLGEYQKRGYLEALGACGKAAGVVFKIKD